MSRRPDVPVRTRDEPLLDSTRVHPSSFAPGTQLIMSLARIANTCLRALTRRSSVHRSVHCTLPAAFDAAKLLGRQPVPANDSLLESSIRDRSILVTGAGGSIGSALCQSIVRHRPRKLVLVERSEFALYEITKLLEELKTSNPEIGQIELVPCLADAGDRPRMTMIMQESHVDVVYHAAAFKHVPIVERNEIEGIRNNSFATWRTAMASIDAGVSLLVLISTDKAVRPAGIMGATKRLAEMILQALATNVQACGAEPRFAIVRFGNVLGSSGSVVPHFASQIASGGPVTITHPDATRYFMSINEAADLVIQAGSIAHSMGPAQENDIFVLDMGEPVRIDDLARRMIALTGKTCRSASVPSGDIEIVHTGLRPGEKLNEELGTDEVLQTTDHPGILRSACTPIDWPTLEAHLHRLEAATDRHDVRNARALLEHIVPDYHPARTTTSHSELSRGDADVGSALKQVIDDDGTCTHGHVSANRAAMRDAGPDTDP